MAGARFLITGTVVVLVSSCCFPLLASGQITHPSEVSALKAVRRKLNDPMKNLRDWKKTDPCMSNWTGVFCINDSSDGFQHVQELRLLNMNLSGRLAPELGQLSNLTILNFLWNSISGRIPKEIGNLSFLKFMLLSGNQLSGSLPDELGSLSSLLIFQVDDNNIEGSLPKSFANLTSLKHFHMNNNSISGQIPPELSALPNLLHFLVDNNNLSGYLPPEFSQMASLKILQLDNNNFGGTDIPASYGNMSKLLKLSLRNCNLQGPVPDLSNSPFLYYVDLSSNKLAGSIPTNRLSSNVTTIDLSNNMLNGSIPSNFSGLPRLQRLSLQNNMLSGDVPSIWENRSFSVDAKLTLDFRNNLLSNVSSTLDPPSNVTIKLQGNPICAKANELNVAGFCGLATIEVEAPGSSTDNSTNECKPQTCPASGNYEYVSGSPVSCFCAAPIGVGIRLRSPSISDFRPYLVPYMQYIVSNVRIQSYQLSIASFQWQEGPRLSLNLKIFPEYSNSANEFNLTELHRIVDFIATFSIPSNDVYGPYEILYFSMKGPYRSVVIKPFTPGMSKGAKAGIILGAIFCFLVLLLVIAILILKGKKRSKQSKVSKKQPFPKPPINTGNVKGYNFLELEAATSSFSDDSQVGRGGYGKVYKGILPNDGTVVAIKRAQQGSLQGQKEFYTEIELLSRLHHRNLVALLGYCDEEEEQMLVYEFMPNGSLQDLLLARFKQPLSFARRLRIALGSARGILYLHTEADPPIIHRDIKPNNILLDAKFTPKVADFGISKLAPTPGGDGGIRSHVTTIVKGTPGYVDPEYFLSNKLTEKSDVYSLGVVFLELLTGMQPVSRRRSIVQEVSGACQSGMMFSIIDRSMGEYSEECVKRFMALALKCCEDSAEARPSMLGIVRELENIYAMTPESEKGKTNPSIQSDASVTGKSGFSMPSVNYDRNSYMFTQLTGSELVSGVIPSIKPR